MLREGHPAPCVTPLCPQHPPDVILVPALRLLNDELRVEEHEATHDHQSHVQVGLWGVERHQVGTVPSLLVSPVCLSILSRVDSP